MLSATCQVTVHLHSPSQSEEVGERVCIVKFTIRTTPSAEQSPSFSCKLNPRSLFRPGHLGPET